MTEPSTPAWIRAEHVMRDFGVSKSTAHKWLNRDLRLACDRAGIPRVSTNGLRRTFGKMHRVRGITLDTVSKLFGHTTAALVRDVYADVEGDDLAKLMERERR